MAKSLKDWLAEGEGLYGEALREYEDLENQLASLEDRLASKKDELNQIAAVVGKPPVESARRAAVQIVDAHAPGSVPNSRSTIARALVGKALGG